MLSTVRKIASHLARRLPRHVEVEDLVGAGSVGLADAMSRRGTMSGTEFEAFAGVRIRGAMLDELRRHDLLPRGSRKRVKQLTRAQHMIEQRLGRNARPSEVAVEAGFDLEAYHAIRTKMAVMRAPISLSIVGLDDDGHPLDVADHRSDLPETVTAHAEIREQLARSMDKLPERARRIMKALYVEGRTLKEVGESIGVTESRVCQIHSEVISTLRDSIVRHDSGTVTPAGCTQCPLPCGRKVE